MWREEKRERKRKRKRKKEREREKEKERIYRKTVSVELQNVTLSGENYYSTEPQRDCREMENL